MGLSSTLLAKQCTLRVYHMFSTYDWNVMAINLVTNKIANHIDIRNSITRGFPINRWSSKDTSTLSTTSMILWPKNCKMRKTIISLPCCYRTRTSKHGTIDSHIHIANMLFRGVLPVPRNYVIKLWHISTLICGNSNQSLENRHMPIVQDLKRQSIDYIWIWRYRQPPASV